MDSGNTIYSEDEKQSQKKSKLFFKTASLDSSDKVIESKKSVMDCIIVDSDKKNIKRGSLKMMPDSVI